MNPIGKRLAVGVLSLVVLTGMGGLVFFKYAQHRVAERLQAPQLDFVDMTAPDMTFHTLDGTTRHVGDYKGKVVFLDLWGTWCVQCVAEMPTVQKLFTRFRGDPKVVFLIVSRMDTPDTVQRYARRNKLDLPFFVMQDNEVPDSMYLHQYPATFIYSKDGRIAAQHAGGADWSDESVATYLVGLENR